MVETRPFPKSAEDFIISCMPNIHEALSSDFAIGLPNPSFREVNLNPNVAVNDVSTAWRIKGKYYCFSCKIQKKKDGSETPMLVYSDKIHNHECHDLRLSNNINSLLQWKVSGCDDERVIVNTIINVDASANHKNNGKSGGGLVARRVIDSRFIFGVTIALGSDINSNTAEAKMIYLSMSAIFQATELGVTEVQTDSLVCCNIFNTILEAKESNANLDTIRCNLKSGAIDAFQWLVKAVDIYLHVENLIYLKYVPRGVNTVADEISRFACEFQETFLFTVVPEQFHRSMFDDFIGLRRNDRGTTQ